MFGIVKMKCIQLHCPFLAELFLILYLVLLYPGIKIGTVTHPLEMKYLGQGLIYHFIPGVTCGESNIRILVVGRRVAIIETAQLLPQVMANQQAGAGNIITLLEIVVFRLFSVIHTPEIPRRAVAPHNGTRLL